MTQDALEVAGNALVTRLGGKWSGGRGMCLCPAHPDRTPSLSVRIGERRLLFHCFAGCDQQAVIAAVRSILASALTGRLLDRESAARAKDGNDDWVRARARALWDEAHALQGSPAAAYLEARGIFTSCAQLRYHPCTPVRVAGQLARGPAMIARISDECGTLAIQRCFLDLPRSRLSMDLKPARRMLGRPGAGAVRLSAHGEVLGLAEGIETALAASILLEIPVWAVLGSARFARVRVPANVARIVLLPDADHAGVQAARRARDAFRAESQDSGALGGRVGTRDARIVMPWHGLNDWNDVLRHRSGFA